VKLCVGQDPHQTNNQRGNSVSALNALKRKVTMKIKSIIASGLALAGFALCPVVRADEVTDWNQHTLTAIKTANQSPFVASRSAAIVASSVFDAVNGIERRYDPIHVPANAPRGASRRAAAVQAAYASLVKLLPAQKADLDAKLAASMSAIASDEAVQDNQSILRGIAWGQAVADAIWTWRSTDGLTSALPPFLGGSAVGQWRPTPPANLAGAGEQFAYMTPWAIPSPSAFRPPGPPALNSAEYLADYNEVKAMGNLTSPLRTADQTVSCNFWAQSTPAWLWNSTALSLIDQNHTTLSQNARLLAALNIAMADAVIACWEAKYHYVFWRPITAIPLAATDGNGDTVEDLTWTTLFATPNHPEYPSGHSTVSGSGAAVLADFFGDNTAFTVYSDSATLPGVSRSFTSFSQALEEVKEARIFAGIHFRAACDDGQATGIQVADYILENSMQRGNGKGLGQLRR